MVEYSDRFHWGRWLNINRLMISQRKISSLDTINNSQFIKSKITVSCKSLSKIFID